MTRTIRAATAGAVPLTVLGALSACGLDWSQGASAGGEAADLVRVVDGDTIVVETGGGEERVRFLGIDAPEVERDGQVGEPCATAATALVEERLRHGDLRLISDRSADTHDRYDRRLAYVEVDGDDLSAELLGEGLAELYYSETDIERYGEYAQLAEEAPVPDCAD